MSPQNILVEKKEGVAKITLNRPRVMNALSEQLLSEFQAVLKDVQDDDSIGVVVITGAGRAFCAGMDLKEMTAAGFLTDEPLRPGGGVFGAVANLEKPVIAAVNGLCYTGGLELVLCCDMIVASEEAMFADTHARYGFMAGAGLTQRLPRRVGVIKAKELILTSEPITAREAERIGLVNLVVPAERLEEAAEELAKKVLQNSPTSVRAIKSLINRGLDVDLPAGLQMELAEYKSHREKGISQESQERLTPFLKKTPASSQPDVE